MSTPPFLVQLTGAATFAAVATFCSPAHASPPPVPALVNQGADLSVSHGDYRYVAASSLAQLAVIRPDGTQFIVHLPGVASALFVHENQLYVGFPSGDLQVFNVAGTQAAAPILALRHRYPHPVGGFALTNGQVVALPADGGGQMSYGPQPPPSTATGPVDQAALRPEPNTGAGLLVTGVLVAGGLGVPPLAVGLNRRLDREGDGWGWIIVGGVGVGIGAILVGIGAGQANRHRKWAKQQYGMRVTPLVHADRRGNWSLGARMRF